jgi:glycosyltransferase involved in cell wall biosynthesis
MFTSDEEIDRRIVSEAESLVAAGWQVRIFALANLSGAAADPPYVTRVGGPVHREKASHAHLRDAYLALRKAPVIGSALLPRLLIGYRTLTGRDLDRVYLPVFEPCFAGLEADVVIGHDLPMLPVAIAAARACGALLVYDSHELYPEQLFSAVERRHLAELEARFIGAADCIVTVNDSIARELEHRYRIGPVTTILNAYDFDPGEEVRRGQGLRKRLGIPQDHKLFLFQGMLSEGRNLSALIAAMAEVRSSSAHLVFLGDGPEKPLLEEQTQRMELSSRVHFHQRVPQSELLALTASADVGLIPYVANCLNNALATPNKLYEYIAAGLPILASGLVEIKRIVERYDFGTIVDFDDPRAIAHAIDAVVADAAWTGMKRTGVQYARDDVNWNVEGGKFVALMERLLKQHRTGEHGYVRD